MPAPTANSLIDAVNDRDEAVGKVRRGDVLRDGRNFRTAHVFVFNAADELLLQRLARQRERHPGRWGSSVAAYLFAGESYRHGATRRMREELGIEDDPDPLGKIEIRDSGSLKFVALFLARSDHPEIRDPEHISELRFLPIREIRERIETNPAEFTPTFLKLFEAFARRL